MEEKDPRSEPEHIPREEPYELLSTKLTPPRLHPGLVSAGVQPQSVVDNSHNRMKW